MWGFSFLALLEFALQPVYRDIFLIQNTDIQDYMSSVVGRFAPSPSGLLHAGSLIAAVGSYLNARAVGGQWLVRMEDLDPPREQLGAATSILQQLEDHGLQWDGEVLYQSTRIAAYDDALTELADQGAAFRCCCSRKQMIENGRTTPTGVIYAGTCRDLGLSDDIARYAWRLKARPETIGFTDLNGCYFAQAMQQDVGDFVIRRADGLFAYQLAVVVDDAYQQITEVVRGADLFDNTPRQLVIQQLLGYSQPQYLHLPVKRNALGQKLSKQTRSPVLDSSQGVENVCQALIFLGLPVTTEHRQGTCAELLEWARLHWSLDALPIDDTQKIQS